MVPVEQTAGRLEFRDNRLAGWSRCTGQNKELDRSQAEPTEYSGTIQQGLKTRVE